VEVAAVRVAVAVRAEGGNRAAAANRGAVDCPTAGADCPTAGADSRAVGDVGREVAEIREAGRFRRAEVLGGQEADPAWGVLDPAGRRSRTDCTYESSVRAVVWEPRELSRSHEAERKVDPDSGYRAVL
jgi:hypothetical protein